MNASPLFFSAIVSVVAIAAATVAVALGKIDGSTFAAIVGVFGGTSAGVGAHAAGVSTGAGK